MKRIKRILGMAIVFVLIFFIIFLCIHFLSKGYTNNYSIHDDISIKEIYTNYRISTSKKKYIKGRDLN